MNIFLDNSEKQLVEKSARYGFDFWQLQTPLSRRTVGARPYAMDNGCFAEFREKTWRRQVDSARQYDRAPMFVTVPDIVGDARRTLELFEHFEPFLRGLPVALVIQDGIGNVEIPWRRISAIFVGGSTGFKYSPEAIAVCKTARILSKWVHIGRVNTVGRLDALASIGDSIDGSGISRFDHMLDDLMSFYTKTQHQGGFDFEN